MNKVVIYTSIYGKKDTLKDPLQVNKDCDYLCFTDNKDIKSDVWKVIYKEPTHEDPVRCAKIFKIKPHDFLKEYDLSLWVDANFLIKNDLTSFFAKCQYLDKADMLLFSHDQGRDCIYDEAAIISAHNKDNPEIVKAQIEKYKKDGYPSKRGLSANSIMLKKHNKHDMIDLANMWWEEVENFSRRDQLSLYYCTWKLNIKHYLLKYPKIDIRNNEWFQWLPHNYESQKWY
tara:strand:- start:81 stop:770 length:690 start_codon:yes stop_codon:yes gene_type:complete